MARWNQDTLHIEVRDGDGSKLYEIPTAAYFEQFAKDAAASRVAERLRISTFTLEDETGPIKGAITTGSTTDEVFPIISGSAPLPGWNKGVLIYDNGKEIGRFDLNLEFLQREWSLKLDHPLADGEHEIAIQYSGIILQQAMHSIKFTVKADPELQVLPVKSAPAAEHLLVSDLLVSHDHDLFPTLTTSAAVPGVSSATSGLTASLGHVSGPVDSASAHQSDAQPGHGVSGVAHVGNMQMDDALMGLTAHQH